MYQKPAHTRVREWRQEKVPSTGARTDPVEICAAPTAPALQPPGFRFAKPSPAEFRPAPGVHRNGAPPLMRVPSAGDVVRFFCAQLFPGGSSDRQVSAAAD